MSPSVSQRTTYVPPSSAQLTTPPTYPHSTYEAHISDRDLARLRSHSKTSLRFALSADASHAAHPHLRYLFRLLLSPVLTQPPLSLYLPNFAPACNALHSMLILLTRHSLPYPIHAALISVAVHPEATQQSPFPNLLSSPKDSITLNFVRAISACPPRVPVELRNAVCNMYTQERLEHIALLGSLGAYYSTLISLLGFVDSHRTRALSQPSITDPSEVSLPSSMSSPSAKASTRSTPARLAQAATHKFRTHITDALRLRMAKHTGDHLQKSTWLSDIPQTRRSQLDYIQRHMGFTTFYLSNISSTTHRAVFIYILRHILLSDSAHGISTAVKNMACFILARCTENAALTAHSAFLATRFGATPRQLHACVDLPYLRSMHRARTQQNAARSERSCSTSSSSLSDMYDGGEAQASEEGNARWAIGRRGVRRRRRTRAYLLDALQSSVSRGVQRIDSMLGRRERDDGISGRGRERFRARASQIDELSPSESSVSEDGDREGETGLERTREVEVEAVSSQDFEIGDNPAVPDVNGLNSIEMDEFDRVSHSDGSERMGPSMEDFYGFEYESFMDEAGLLFHEEGVSSGFAGSLGMLDGDDGSSFGLDDNNPDLDLLTEKETAFLLMAHEVGQAWRRNSRLSEKYAEANPWPLLSTELACDMHALFDADGIMEMTSVIAAFHFLQRWTVCFEYRSGVFEEAIRRFMKSDVGRRLGVSTVGQRCASSEFSECLRGDCRSLRLPRHAVVTPFQRSQSTF